MYCSNCGEKVPDGAAFCPKCGARVGAPEDSPNAKPETSSAEGFIDHTADEIGNGIDDAFADLKKQLQGNRR